MADGTGVARDPRVRAAMTPGRPAGPDGPVALHGVRVFEGDGLSRPRTVIVRDGVFDDDPHAATPVDASGTVLLPGLIDAHVHLHEPENLRRLARHGVTTALDMGCWPHKRVARLRSATDGAADFRTAGLPAIGPDGPHSRMPGMLPEAIVRTEHEARAHVARQAAQGVHYAKAIAEAPGGGGPTPDVLAAVVAAAREHSLATVVHAASVGAYSVAVGSGAEIVTHLPVTGRICPEDIATLAAQGRTVVPTAVMMAGLVAGRPGDGGHLDDLLAGIAALHAAGVALLAGTDANDVPGVPVPIAHGSSLHDELALLVRAGMSTVEALRAATSAPARLFGLTDRGTVRPGMRADAVLLGADPVADIRATRAIRAVWCAGRRVSDAVPIGVGARPVRAPGPFSSQEG